MTESEDLIENIIQLVKELYSNLPDEINYKYVYKYLLYLPFDKNIHDIIFSMSNLYYSDKESVEYLSKKLYKLDEYIKKIEEDDEQIILKF